MAHRRPVPVDALWALLFATAGLIAITYARLPPEELYNVSEEGIKPGSDAPSSSSTIPYR